MIGHSASPVSKRTGLLAVTAGLCLAAAAQAHRLEHREHGLESALPEHHVAELLRAASLDTLYGRVGALISEYHLTGDDHLLERGRALLQSPLGEETSAPTTLLAAAWLAQAGHDFTGAQHYLDRVVQLRPRFGEAWLLRASVALVQGRVTQSREACHRTSLAVPLPVTAACFALADAHDAAPEAIREIYQRLITIAGLQAPVQATPPEGAELLAWLHGVAADLAARAGLDLEAGRHYRAALDVTPTVSLRAGYADLLLATGKPRVALKVVARHESAPALVLRRLLAQRMMGEGPPKESLQRVEARFATWIEAQDFRHAREMAMYYLYVAPNDLLAYRLARENFRVQREPEDRALLCAAARRLGRSGETACTGITAGLPLNRAVSSIHGG